jgi:1-acyl-sn-glycerol-3-phosphate acyltransferase
VYDRLVARELDDPIPGGFSNVVRGFFDTLVGLYYPVIECEGLERLPLDRPIIFAPNHPNALLDPIALRLAVDRSVRFLAKSPLFENLFLGYVLQAYGALPIYRVQDTGSDGGDRVGNNERLFASCARLLARREWIAIFPEGTSHSGSTLKPLKTGAARIALAAEAQFSVGVAIVPVGLIYQDKATFRSRVLVVIGDPIDCAPLTDEYRKDERRTVEALTGRMREALDRVVLQADTRELLEGIGRIASLAGDGPVTTLEAQRDRTRRLLDGYRALLDRDPARLEAIVGDARRYLRTLSLLGVEDPWAVEIGRIKPTSVARVTFQLAALAPFALVGAAMSWLPYRAVGWVAKKVTKEEDVLSTVKLLGGALFLLVAWLAESIAVGVWRGGWAGLATFFIALVTGYAALRWDEIASRAWEALSAMRVRQKGDLAQALTERRRALCIKIEEALDGK